MKILVMSFGSDAGGIEKSLVEFLHYLAGKDVSVDLYLWRKPGVLYDQITDGVNVIHYQAYPGSLGDCLHSKHPIANALWYARFRLCRLFGDEVKAFKPFPGEYDVAISYCQNGYSPHYVIDKVKAKKKYMWYHHGSYEGRGMQKRMDARRFVKYDQVIAVSRACEQMLLGHFPQLQGKTTVIHNLINEQDILDKAQLPVDEPWIDAQDGCKIVTVGRISPEKGQVLAIEAAKLLKENGFKFHWIFVGDGPHRDTCEQMTMQYGLQDCCHFVGVKINPYPYMKLADIYVQPSVFEADPITIAEALLLERFIITSDIPAMREALCDGKYGILTERSANAMAEAITAYAKENSQKELLQNILQAPLRNEIIQNSIAELIGLAKIPKKSILLEWLEDYHERTYAYRRRDHGKSENDSDH